METCGECGGDMTVMESWVTVGEKPPERRGDVGVCNDCGSRFLRPDGEAPWQQEGAIDPPKL